MTHDVVVAGGGPGGALAALLLARAGARVLLLEKKPLGRDKLCGGGLTNRAWAGLEVGIDDLVGARTDVARIQRSRRPVLQIPLGDDAVWMVRRCEFDRRLAEAAAAAGAEVHDGEAALSAEADAGGVTVVTARGRHRAGCLLVATGAEAPLRRDLGLGTPAGTMAVGVEIEGPATARLPDQRTLIFDYAIPGGYAWVFPKGDCWNAGVVSADPRTAPQLRRRLAAFLDEVGLRFDGHDAARARGHRIPFWGGAGPLHRGRVALVGDAAGLADPFFGEGIASALESGRLAARAALDLAAGRASDLSGYSAAVESVITPHLRHMAKVSRVVYRAPGISIRLMRTLPTLRAVARRVATEPFEAGGAAA